MSFVMKNIVFCCLFACLVGFVSHIAAQTCYHFHFDQSGYNMSPDLGSREIEACILKNSLPSFMRDSFLIHEYGLYLHTSVFVNGTEKSLDLIRAQIESESKYYLLVVKVSTEDALYSDFIVELNLLKIKSLQDSS
jgi:hypothetical protein